MLPKRFYNESKIQLFWKSYINFNNFLPSLKRADKYLKFNKIVLTDAEIILDKNTQLIKFLIE